MKVLSNCCVIKLNSFAIRPEREESVNGKFFNRSDWSAKETISIGN